MQSVAVFSVVLVALIAVCSANIVLPEGVELPSACKTAICPHGFTCMERENTSPFCILSPCPHIARCVPTFEPKVVGRCPAITPGSIGVCAFMCSSDSDCGANQKCCRNGCGGTACTNTV